MSHEAAYPERSQTPEAQLFNVDAMSDEQITIVYRGLIILSNEDQGEPYDHAGTNGWLLEYLASDVRDLATRDPERVRLLVEKLATSANEADHNLAATAARGLARYDYPFARDVLIQSINSDSRGGMVGETALLEAGRMVSDLTPDEAVDFRAHVAMSTGIKIEI